MTAVPDPVIIRALRIIQKHFWGEHADRATHQILRLWLEGLPDANAVIFALVDQGYLYTTFHALSREHGYQAYHLTDFAQETIRRSQQTSEASALAILPLDSYLRQPLSYRTVRHLVQVVHLVAKGESVSVERLSYSHPQFGLLALARELTDMDRQIAEGNLNARISSFLRAAVRHGLLIEMTPGEYQKTSKGFSLATNLQLV